MPEPTNAATDTQHPEPATLSERDQEVAVGLGRTVEKVAEIMRQPDGAGKERQSQEEAKPEAGSTEEAPAPETAAQEIETPEDLSEALREIEGKPPEQVAKILKDLKGKMLESGRSAAESQRALNEWNETLAKMAQAPEATPAPEALAPERSVTERIAEIESQAKILAYQASNGDPAVATKLEPFYVNALVSAQIAEEKLKAVTARQDALEAGIREKDAQAQADAKIQGYVAQDGKEREDMIAAGVVTAEEYVRYILPHIALDEKRQAAATLGFTPTQAALVIVSMNNPEVLKKPADPIPTEEPTAKGPSPTIQAAGRSASRGGVTPTLSAEEKEIAIRLGRDPKKIAERLAALQA